MAATYRAMSQSPRQPHLMPVFTSELAQRRWRKSQPKSSTEVWGDLPISWMCVWLALCQEI